MKQVIDHLRFGALGAHLQIKRGVHVHRDGFDALASLLAQELEKRSNSFSAAVLTYPQHAHSLGIHDHRGIAAPLVQSKLIHHQAAHALGVKAAVQGLQALLVNAFDGVPVQPRQPV